MNFILKSTIFFVSFLISILNYIINLNLPIYKPWSDSFIDACDAMRFAKSELQLVAPLTDPYIVELFRARPFCPSDFIIRLFRSKELIFWPSVVRWQRDERRLPPKIMCKVVPHLVYTTGYVSTEYDF